MISVPRCLAERRIEDTCEQSTLPFIGCFPLIYSVILPTYASVVSAWRSIVSLVGMVCRVV
jgi:hypothetical protein